MDKRTFLKTSLLFAISSPLTSYRIPIKKNILILGGRGFIGPRIITTLLERGHKVTMLNRGKTNPHLFSNLPLILCDREVENRRSLSSIKHHLESQSWDAVIDTWQKSPKAVEDFLEEFGSSIKDYHYISTLSVYDNWNEIGINEDAKLNDVPSFPQSISTDYRYAIRKTLSEYAIMESGIERFTIYRCHGIRNDSTPNHKNPHEEPYWPIRFLKGGNILIPKVKNHLTQMTDGQSLCNFLAHNIENEISGIYNVAYPSIPFTEYITALQNVADSNKKLIWIPGEFLIENGIAPNQEIEYWKTRPIGYYTFDMSKAIAKGLRNRPISEMLKDQIKGYLARYPNNDFEFGKIHNGDPVKLSAEKEADLIKKWKMKN